MTLPNFIIGGAPKCGTTALWAYLDEHPDVFLSRNKEPRFFTAVQGELERGVIGSGPHRSGTYFRGLDWYERLFEARTSETAVGEATTDYFAAPDSNELIHRHIPGAKFIFVLRDPVDRMYSHYWQECKLGWPLPTFVDMIKTDHPRLEFYADVSTYRKHLARFAETFGRDRILLVLTAELRAEPSGPFRRVCEFLGIDDMFTPSSLGREYNSQRLPRNARLQRTMARVHGSRLARNLPDSMRAGLRRVRERLMAWNSKPNSYAPLPSSARGALVERFRDDARFVERWTGNDLRSWLG